jgi:hypothetical protein
MASLRNFKEARIREEEEQSTCQRVCQNGISPEILMQLEYCIVTSVSSNDGD